MVKIFTLLLLSSITFGLQAQIKFFKIYTDEGFDKGEGITQLSDSSYLITGSSTSFESGPPKAYIMKIDSLGNHLWAKQYGGQEINEGKRVFAIEGDGYYVLGNTSSNPTADFNFYFIKTDEAGEPLIQKQFGTSQWDFVNDAMMLADSSFILTGETYNTIDGMQDAYTIHVNKVGDTLWTRQSFKPGIDKINAIENVGDTAFVLAGTIWNPDSLAQKSFVGFYKNDQTVIWEKEYGVTGDFQINDVVLWNNIFHCVGDRILVVDSLRDEYVHRINLLGDTLSYYSYLGNSDKTFSKLVKYGPSNKFYIAISAQDQYSFGTGEDIYLARFDDYMGYDYSGVIFNAGGQDDVGDLINTSDGGAIMVGTNRSFGTGNANVYVLKVGANDDYPVTSGTPNINSLVEIIENSSLLLESILFPNPTKGDLEIHLSQNVNGTIQIMNNLGQIIRVEEIKSIETKLNIQDLSKGIYFVQFISSEGKTELLGKILKN
ncbi:MAG: T9SS type A sorting domain-containing protein [Crocinitomicaceae bacterium]